jgi:hypothetical protein
MVHAASRARRGGIVAVLALCFLMTGCVKSKVTKDNFDKIKNDMTLEDVEGILGKGDSVGDGSNVAGQFGVDVTGGAPPSSGVDYVWESGKKSITVSFRGGKVVAKRSEGL